MILVRTPLRLELLGGSTDIASFYKKATGRILEMAIEHSVHIALNKRWDDGLKLSYAVIEEVPHVGYIKHERTKAALKRFHISKGVEIASISDVSSAGSGLGSSSSFTVALAHALATAKNKKMTPRELAEMACKIEIGDVKAPIGKQDQYAAAFGGLNELTFQKNGYVNVHKLTFSPAALKKFNEHLMVFDTGAGHSASNILEEQKKSEKENFKTLVRMAELVPRARRAVEKGDFKNLGTAMQEEWNLKKTLSSGVTSPVIERIGEKGRKAGGWGGRLSGAGGGGFVVFFVPPKARANVRSALKGYRQIQMKLQQKGSEVLFKS